ncbi:MAG: hypothetical protein J6I36_10780 [Bacteroidaceae bacterium]|nr:hypothetical protein [Bacteroidaceae bacterium]
MGEEERGEKKGERGEKRGKRKGKGERGKRRKKGRGLRGNPQAPLPQWERRKGERGEKRGKRKGKGERGAFGETLRHRCLNGRGGKGREERGREGD